MRTLRPALLVAGLLAACDAQVDPSFFGDPQARLRGTAAGFEAGELHSARIVWNRNEGIDVPNGPRTAEPIHLEFPADVTIDVLGVPPEDAFVSVDVDDGALEGGSSFAEGYLRLADADGAIIGAAVDVALVYVRGAPAPGSLTADYLGGVPSPGYHLLAWRATAALTASQTYFTQRCVDAMVAKGALDADAADTACRLPRRYKLVDSAADLDTPILFYRRSGGP